MKARARKRRGFALMVAVVILVILGALLAAFFALRPVGVRKAAPPVTKQKADEKPLPDNPPPQKEELK